MIVSQRLRAPRNVHITVPPSIRAFVSPGDRVVPPCHLVIIRATRCSTYPPFSQEIYLVLLFATWYSTLASGDHLCNLVLHPATWCSTKLLCALTYHNVTWCANVPLSHWLETSFSLFAILHFVIAIIIAMSQGDWGHRSILQPRLTNLDIFNKFSAIRSHTHLL